MDFYSTDKIRNIVLLGHGGSGKTSLTEALLYLTKGTDRLGSVPAGNTCSDYDPEETKRGFSISTSLAPVIWKGVKINILDTPGYFDFAGEVNQAVRVGGAAVIVVDGKAGMEVGTELAWDYVAENKIPKAFFLNRFDDPDAHFGKVYTQLHEKFGVAVCPVQIPLGEPGNIKGFANLIEELMYTYDPASNSYKSAPIPDEFRERVTKYRGMLYESIAQTSEELMEKFFNEEPISKEEAQVALHDGIMSGEIVPVFAGSATKVWGLYTLLETMVGSFPTPVSKKEERVIDADGNEKKIPIDPNGDTAIFVFKTIADPFVGKMSFFKVMNGTLKKDMVLRNVTTGIQEKMSRIYIMRGKKQIDVDALCCGDIGVTAKLINTNTNDTLTASASDIRYTPIEYPKAYMTMVITPKDKGDEDKISLGISKLLEEDPTLRYENDPETKQLLLSGLGDMQLDVVVAKLKNRFGTSVDLAAPKVAYRETIKKTVDVEGKHKKQSGGSGQYGHVKIVFSPGEAEGLTFTESVFGGSVPRQYFPAVEKGLQEAMAHGVLAGYPVVHLAANLYDGSYHEVDSNEISFKLAATLAYKEGLPKADPVLLEPVGELRVYVPGDYVGDVMGDLNKRRGRVLSMEPYEKKTGYQTVVAEIPKSEMANYVIALRAMTQGRGSFDFKVVRYDEVPQTIAQKVIAEAKNKD